MPSTYSFDVSHSSEPLSGGRLSVANVPKRLVKSRMSNTLFWAGVNDESVTCSVPARFTPPDTLSRSNVPAVVSLISIRNLPLAPCVYAPVIWSVPNAEREAGRRNRAVGVHDSGRHRAVAGKRAAAKAKRERAGGKSAAAGDRDRAGAFGKAYRAGAGPRRTAARDRDISDRGPEIREAGVARDGYVGAVRNIDRSRARVADHYVARTRPFRSR